MSTIRLQHAPSVPIWLPSLQRAHDSYLVDHITQSCFSLTEQCLLNEWRMYLHLLTVADLATSTGTAVSPDIYFGWKSSERSSQLHWPTASHLHSSHLPLWQRFLDTLHINMRLIQPLGPWLIGISPHQHWNYRLDPSGGLSKFDSNLCTYSELQPTSSRVSSRRGKFLRCTFIMPLEFSPEAAVSTWRMADIIEKGHYQRPTEFLTVSSSSTPCIPDCDDTPPSALLVTSFDHFCHALSLMDLTCRRLIGTFHDTISAASLDHIAHIFCTEGLTCVSDGSFSPKLGRGSHVWIVTLLERCRPF